MEPSHEDLQSDLGWLLDGLKDKQVFVKDLEFPDAVPSEFSQDFEGCSQQNRASGSLDI